MSRRFTATSGDEGRRLDAWLAEASGASRSEVGRLIERGMVTLRGRVAGKSHRMSPGEMVEVNSEGEPAPATVAAGFSIRYEDEHLAVVAKPAGVLVHQAPGRAPGKPRGGRTASLAEALSEVMPLAPGAGEGRPGVVHRLDRDTSGLLVFAKTDEAHARLVESMKKRRIRRRYLALVLGRLESTTGRIEAPIGRASGDPRRRRVTGSGKRAVTEFRVVGSAGGFTLVQAELVTGRTHQIRVHFSHIGHPVVGDPRYGQDTLTAAAEIELDRPFLHAVVLEFLHPFTGEPITVEEELPPDLQEALRRARIQD